MDHTSHPNERAIPRTIKRAAPNPQEGAALGRESGGRPMRRFAALGLAVAARRTAAAIAWAKSNTARLTALAAGPIPDTTEREAGIEFDAGAIARAIRTVHYQASKPGHLVPRRSSRDHRRHAP
jgi:hypothetical protein